MDQAALVMDEIEAGADLIRALDRYAPIKIAFWLRPDEDGSKGLYLVSDRFDSCRPAAYEEVGRIINEKPSLFLDPSEVTLLPPDNRWAVAAEKVHDPTNRRGTKLRSAPFGDQYIADAYIYPLPLKDGFPRKL